MVAQPANCCYHHFSQILRHSKEEKLSSSKQNSVLKAFEALPNDTFVRPSLSCAATQRDPNFFIESETHEPRTESLELNFLEALVDNFRVIEWKISLGTTGTDSQSQHCSLYNIKLNDGVAVPLQLSSFHTRTPTDR